MKSVAWLFPVIFMLHEMEEIIGLRIWLDKNTDIINKYNKFSAVYKNYSNEGFSTAVLEEYLLCIIITIASIYFRTYIVWLGAFIAFSLHLFFHIINKVIYNAKYSIFSITISSTLCLILMMLNLKFVHKLMDKVTEIIKICK